MRRKCGKGAAEWYGKNRKRQKINANNRVKRRRKSSKPNYEKRRRGKTKIRKFEEIWTSVEMERVAKATERRWPKEKELLDKGDGLATAAGARRNDEVTSQNISKYIQIHEGSLVRLTVVFRRS